MKNIDKVMMSKLKESGYSFEEIQRINNSIESANKGELIPFYDVMENFYKNNEKIPCTK